MLASTDTSKPTRKVEWRWPMARDNSAYPPLITSFPRDIISPYEFPIGRTRIVYTATDRSGNSQSCVFTVTIIGRNTCTLFIILEVKWPFFLVVRTGNHCSCIYPNKYQNDECSYNESLQAHLLEGHTLYSHSPSLHPSI